MDMSTKITSLGEEPRSNLAKFRDDLTAYAATLCTNHHNDGLNHYHVTKTHNEYMALNLYQVDDNGAIIRDEDGMGNRLARVPIPQQPARPVGAANHAAEIGRCRPIFLKNNDPYL
jgi:hypothetical protein